MTEIRGQSIQVILEAEAHRDFLLRVAGFYCTIQPVEPIDQSRWWKRRSKWQTEVAKVLTSMGTRLKTVYRIQGT